MKSLLKSAIFHILIWLAYFYSPTLFQALIWFWWFLVLMCLFVLIFAPSDKLKDMFEPLKNRPKWVAVLASCLNVSEIAFLVYAQMPALLLAYFLTFFFWHSELQRYKKDLQQ